MIRGSTSKPLPHPPSISGQIVFLVYYNLSWFNEFSYKKCSLKTWYNFLNSFYFMDIFFVFECSETYWNKFSSKSEQTNFFGKKFLKNMICVRRTPVQPPSTFLFIISEMGSPLINQVSQVNVCTSVAPQLACNCIGLVMSTFFIIVKIYFYIWGWMKRVPMHILWTSDIHCIFSKLNH